MAFEEDFWRDVGLACSEAGKPRKEVKTIFAGRRRPSHPGSPTSSTAVRRERPNRRRARQPSRCA